MTYIADEASLDTWKPSQEADGAKGSCSERRWSVLWEIKGKALFTKTSCKNAPPLLNEPLTTDWTENWGPRYSLWWRELTKITFPWNIRTLCWTFQFPGNLELQSHAHTTLIVLTSLGISYLPFRRQRHMLKFGQMLREDGMCWYLGKSYYEKCIHTLEMYENRVYHRPSIWSFDRFTFSNLFWPQKHSRS